MLNTPTINKFWSFSSLPEVSELDEDETPASKSLLKKMDSLHRPAVPVEYLDEDLEKFLSSNPLADWRSQVQGGTEGRYLSVDPTVFPTIVSCS